jgi:hypothetical protein
MQFMRTLFLAALLLPAIALLACGGGGNSDENQVESVIRSYIDYYIKSEPAEMYALLDAGSQERCSEENFVSFISKARDALGDREFKIEQVANLVVEGDSASATVIATVDGEETDSTDNTLVKEDGVWKLELPSVGC